MVKAASSKAVTLKLLVVKQRAWTNFWAFQSSAVSNGSLCGGHLLDRATCCIPEISCQKLKNSTHQNHFPIYIYLLPFKIRHIYIYCLHTHTHTHTHGKMTEAAAARIRVWDFLKQNEGNQHFNMQHEKAFTSFHSWIKKCFWQFAII